MFSLRSASDLRGFTVLELLTAVAVIGTLASLSIASYHQNQRKSLQAEAKIAISAMYSLEKSFYSEYSAYAPALNAISFAPEGYKRYYVTTICPNFAGAAWTGSVTGYSGDFSVYWYDRVNYPASFTANAFNPASNCSGADCATLYPTNDPQSFRAQAKGQLCATCYRDAWQIDQLKNIQNCSDGLL